MILTMSWTKRLIPYGKRVFKEIGEDDLSGAAAELAYRFFLALFPFFLFLAAMGGFVADIFGISNPTQEIMDLLGQSLPADAASVLRTELESVVESRDGALLSIGIAGAIWASSSGIGTIVKGMNRIYEVKETRPIWKRYLLNVGLTILGGVFAIGSFVLLFVGQLAGSQIAGELGLADETAAVIQVARWPAIIAMLIVATAFLYWAAPNVKLPFSWITPGAVVFIIGWIIMSIGFGFYVANFGSYNATYGTLGGIVILLSWFYLTSFLFMLGAEINAVLAQEEIPEKLPDTPEEGATPDTVPPHKEGEVRAKQGAGATAGLVSKPRAGRLEKSRTTGPAAVAEPKAPVSKSVTALAMLVAAITFWRVVFVSKTKKVGGKDV